MRNLYSSLTLKMAYYSLHKATLAVLKCQINSSKMIIHYICDPACENHSSSRIKIALFFANLHFHNVRSVCNNNGEAYRMLIFYL